MIDLEFSTIAMSTVDVYDRKPVVVFGATGKTGKLVVNDLLSRGLRVRAVARSPEKASKTLLQNDRLELRQGDICNEESLRDAVKGSQAVVWAAAGDFVALWLPYLWKGESVSTPYTVDYLGVKRVIDAVKSEEHFKRFVFLSGGLAGKTTHPVALVGNLIGGGGPYYKGLAEDYVTQSGVPFTVVRPAGRLHDKPLTDEEGEATLPQIMPAVESTFGPIGRELAAYIIGQSLQQPMADKVSFNVIDGKKGPKSEIATLFATRLESM